MKFDKHEKNRKDNNIKMVQVVGHSKLKSWTFYWRQGKHECPLGYSDNVRNNKADLI